MTDREVQRDGALVDGALAAALARLAELMSAGRAPARPAPHAVAAGGGRAQPG